ncbi:hypothetical protein PFISCL1PPCAC_13012, partial [Pristionchus fissidentatus]
SSAYPGESGLPLDPRNSGLINCAMTSVMGQVRKCRGHACYVIQRTHQNDNFGCIMYDERYMDRKLLVGAHQMVDERQFICDRDMCNAGVDTGKVFAGLTAYDEPPPANESCNCFDPPTPDSPVTAKSPIDLALVLGISIPACVFLVLFFSVSGYRIYSKRWPAPLFFLNSKSLNGRPSKSSVVTVVSTAKNK